VIIESVFEGDRGHVTARAWGRDPVDALQSIHWLMSGHGLAVEPTTRFLNFAGFDERREAANIVAGPPDPATVGRQVYLSYAWGEDTTEIGRLRERAAVRTIERLTAAGYAVTYDRKDMRVGDLISAFITRIGTAPDVVAILSKKYLESPYCVKELYGLFLSAKSNKSAFLRSIHPIPLADAQLGDRQAWRSYKKHWEEKKGEIEELFPHGSDGGVLTALEISHWLLDLTTVLSHIGDKLSPSVVDEDLDELIGRALAMLRDR
jgi:internalin A